jgi:hypothetical protein
MEAKDLALLSLGKGLLARNYHFITATPRYSSSRQ